MMKKMGSIAMAVFFMVVVAGSFGASTVTAAVSLSVDAKVNPTNKNVPHFWSACVGTGTMWYSLKPQWKVAARTGASEAGFKRMRGHGMLRGSDGGDSLKIFHWDGTNAPTYTWTVLDSILSNYLSYGMQPIMELDFMPKDLQSNGVTSKPKNWNIWRDFIKAIVVHCESKYGVAEVRTWFWEVWNEPDYNGFWNGSIADYDTLYAKAAEGGKSADSLVLFGGPSSTGSGQLSAFLTYCTNNKVPLDFLSNHCYGGGGSGPSADPVNIRADNRTRATLIKNSGKKLYSLNTEYNSSYSGQGGNTGANCISMDSHINAGFVAKTAKLILDDYSTNQYALPDVLSYWTISDVFDEGSYMENHNLVPFGQVFGLINYQGLRKATFNGFKMLNMMGTTRVSLTGGSSDADGVDGFATLSQDSTKLTILVYRYYKTFSTVKPDTAVTLTINNLPFANSKLKMTHYRVDSLHSNPYAVWLKQGKPAAPSTTQWAALHAAESLAVYAPDTQFTYSGSAFTTSFTMPTQSVSLLVIRKSDTVTSITSERSVKSTGQGYLSMLGNKLLVSAAINSEVIVSVFNTSGRMVKKYQTLQKTVDVSKGLKAGVYMVNAEVGTTKMIQRMIVRN